MVALSDTGGELYNKLTDLMYFGEGTYEEEIRAAKIAASMYLNSKGIPGHRFLDRGSRSSGRGTHNFVIWNMGRVQMVGIDPSSDQEAIEYYNRTKKIQDLLAQADIEAYHQAANPDFYITKKNGSIISPKDKHLDDAARQVIKEVSERFNSTANVRDIIDKLREKYRNLIDSSSASLKQAEDELAQLRAKPFTPKLYSSITTREGLLENQRGRINHYQAVLDTLEGISDVSMGKVPPHKLASSLKDILNGTPKGTFEEDLAEPLSKEARKQMRAVYKKYAGTEQYLKAPNGERSNLTERQWLAVRTPLFKAWFGDWENDPEHASKVLDENGEPRVVYHGTPSAGFDVFNTSGEGGSYDTGAWFTSRLENGETYTLNEDDGGVYAVFLNIRSPFTIDAAGRHWNDLSEITIYDNETGEEFHVDADGKPFASVEEAEQYISEELGYDARNDPNVYPVDEDGYETYTPENERYTVQVNNDYSTTNEVVRGVFGGELSAGADGVIFKDILDSAFDGSFKLYLSDVFVVPGDTNIKSATGNNGKYSNQDSNIYHQLISVDGARTLDTQEGVTTRMDLLANAERLENSGISAKDIWYYTSWARGKDGNWRYELPYGRVIDRYNFTKQDEAEFSKLWLKSTRGTITPQEDKRLQELQPCFEGVSLADVLDAPELFNAYPALRAIKYQERELKDGYEGFYNPRRKTITMSTHLSGEEFRHYLIHEVQHVIQHLEGFAGGSSFLWDYDEKHIQLRDRAEKILDRLNDNNLKAEWLAAIDDFDNAKIRTLLNGVTDINQRQIYLELQKVYYAICKRYDKVYEQYARKSGEVEARNASTRSTMTEKQRELKPPFATEDMPRDKQTIGRRMRKMSISAGNTYHQAVRSADDFTLTPEARRQMDEVRRKYEGTSQWMKAPKGSPTFLTEQQWLAVRTPNFKRWFGDWENDPEHASKILGANGEPLRVYHGTPIDPKSLRVFKSGTVGWLGPGIYLASWPEYAEQFTGTNGKDGILTLFLNLRNPITLTSGKPYLELLHKLYGDRADAVYKERYDAVMNRDKDIISNMPKAADIDRYVHRRIVTGDEVQQLLAQGYDGIDWNGGEYSVLDPNQVKSATRNNGEYSLSDLDQYHQATKRSNFSSRINSFFDAQDTFVGMDGKGQRQAISIPEQQLNAVRRKYEGTAQWLKAPNGSPTFLTEKQWLQVRTPNFKRWFGDWENTPENASKVLDENGEPRVVYHGTDTEEISVFNTKGQDRTKGAGAFFIGSEEVANTYVRGNLSHNNVYPVFLNIRNPYVLNGGNRYWSTLLEYHVYDNARDRNIFIKNDGANFTSRDDAEDYIRNVLHDSNRYTVQEGKVMTTDEIARFVWKFKKGNAKRFDGVIIKNILDVGTPPARAFNPVSDEFIIPKPEQIESATRNNGEYSPTTPDHYHQIIGKDGAEAIDKAEGVTMRMDNLKKAKEMDAAGMPVFAIWRNTGWMKGAERET